MPKKLILVDYENVQRIDLSVLDDTYRAIIFVGVNQNIPKAALAEATAHRFRRADFRKIEGVGKNALDFHIAFQLGRTYETAPATLCIVLSRDKGFDPLIRHLNSTGFKCRRIDTLDDLVAEIAPVGLRADLAGCNRCGKVSTIEHHGGRWCSNCGAFSISPDPSLLPSRQSDCSDRTVASRQRQTMQIQASPLKCDWCYRSMDTADGIYDDGEWMCGVCIARYSQANE